MNPAKCDAVDYIQFLVAAQRRFTCSEAARCQPESPQAPAHDAFTRLLRRQPPGTEALWQETQGLVRREEGVLVLDGTTLDKPYAKRMELVSRHWSGRHKRVVWGINLLTLLWTDGNALIACDFRVYDRPLSGLTKNDHFRRMLEVAEGRGFQPRWVLFDSWYTSLENLKAIRDKGWLWLSQLAIQPAGESLGSGEPALGHRGDTPRRPAGTSARLWIDPSVSDGLQRRDVEHWATNDLEMPEQQRESLARQAWGIETYHRGLKQCCGVEKCQVRTAEDSGITSACPSKPSCGWKSTA